MAQDAGTAGEYFWAINTPDNRWTLRIRKKWEENVMCDSEAEKILFILNKHERAYRRLIPVYIFLAIVLWILPILLIVYLYFCIVDNEFLRIGFCIAWTAYYFLSLFKYFVKYFFPLDREDLLNLMDLAKDSPDAKQELLERLLSGKK
ncbi:TPA: hypothetical protein JZG36_004466 [Escherichia coli]|nr:hypothetical protein [Escherichia coli]